MLGEKKLYLRMVGVQDSCSRLCLASYAKSGLVIDDCNFCRTKSKKRDFYLFINTGNISGNQ